MKGQASAEYLILSFIAISLLSISVFALLNVREYAQKSSDVFSFRSSALSLGNAISEVCALGNGNGRSVFLKSMLSVEYQDSVVRFSNSNTSIVSRSICEVEPADDLDGLVYVKNEDGLITVSLQYC